MDKSTHFFEQSVFELMISLIDLIFVFLAGSNVLKV